MAVVDIPNKTVTLKIVYCGCSMCGKTTNLQSLHRITDPENSQGLVSIATKDDRTLFFDLLPMELGQIGGLLVKVKLYTVPGQVHYELTRRQVLGGCDGVVLVADSGPDKSKVNAWALENLRFNLKTQGLDPDQVPLVLQWNKRDLPAARPVAEMAAELNPRGLPAHEAVAVTGVGVVETFATVLKKTIYHTYQKTGRTQITEAMIEALVDKAVGQFAVHPLRPGVERKVQFDHRFDMDAYTTEQAEQGKGTRWIVDEKSLLSESVNANMQLAERLDEFNKTRHTNDRRKEMMRALARLAPQLADPEHPALPDGSLQVLVDGAGRKQGSMLLFQPGKDVMADRQVAPDGPDLLNGVVSPGLGSLAYRLSQEKVLRIFEDLEMEVFFGTPPPEAQDVASALLAPLRCDGLAFGSLIVYSRVAETPFDEAESEYWSTAATLIGLSLHWRALRKKVAAQVG